MSIKNTGDWNTGNCNTGNWNTGDWNTGNRNTGYRNTGDWNTGNCNTGYRNTGNRNTGNCNTGDCNTGYRNTGNRNTGYWNTGDWNTGDYNTGDWNTGYRNTGDWNTGDYNTGDWNTGYCNSITPEDCLIFNKPAKRKQWLDAEKPEWMRVDLTAWIAETNMTEKEKKAYPSYVTTGGYLKHYTSLQHAWAEAWEKTTQEDRELTYKLPNFDPVVFKEVFGFDPMPQKHTITIDGKTIQLSSESFAALKNHFS